MPKDKKSVQSNPATAILKKIKKLRSEEVTPDSIVKLNDIVRKYLKLKYSLKLSLTSEEILAHINQKRIKKSIKLDLHHLIVQIYKLEYQHPGPPSVNEFEEVSRLAFRTIQEIAMNKVIREVKREGGKKKESKPSSEQNTQYIKLEELLNSLGENFQTDWTNKEIRNTYKKIRLIYSKLSDKEKVRIYPRIKSLFDLSKIKKS